MKNLKKIFAVATVVGMLGAGGAVYASTSGTDNVTNAGNVGRGFCGQFAKDGENLDGLKATKLEQKKAILDQRVKDGKLTQEQADEIYNALKENQANCDGTGSAGIGKKAGAGFGQGRGQGMGRASGMGEGRGTCTIK